MTYFLAPHEGGNIACCDYGVINTTPQPLLVFRIQALNSKATRTLFFFFFTKEVKHFKCFSFSLRGVLTCRSLHSVGVWCLDTDFDDPSPRLWSLKIPQQSSCSTWPSPGFTWHLKTFSHLLSPKPYVTDSKWDRERSETKKKEVCRNNHSPPPPTSNLALFETTSAMWFYLLLNGDWISMACITLCCAVQDCKVRRADEGKVKEKVYTFALSVA